jgi:hypothetical protein
MKNAYERFGKLAYVRHTAKTATNIRVLLDAYVGEEPGKAHLISVVGGDTEIGALAAAFVNGYPFTLIDPGGREQSSRWATVRCVFAGRSSFPGAVSRCGTWWRVHKNSSTGKPMANSCW